MEFSIDGAERFPDALSLPELELLEQLAQQTVGKGPGTRITGNQNLSALLAQGSSIDSIAKSVLGSMAKPVRAIMFDKSADGNWALGWHQDRTIAVEAKVDAPGFGPWSTKAGIPHVEPPFDYIAKMITLRAHLDGVDADNAPLLIAPGSHRLGRIPVTDIPGIVAETGSVACHAGAGDVWLYATAILHASEAAKKPSHRRVLHVDYANASLPGNLEWCLTSAPMGQICVSA